MKLTGTSWLLFRALEWTLVVSIAHGESGFVLGEARTIDGTGNNVANSTWGSAGAELLRRAPAAYANGTDSPAGTGRPSPRLASNLCNAQSGSRMNAKLASDFLWQWGQFIDHDLDLTSTAVPGEPFNIPVPAGDPFFDPTGTGTKVIGLNRSHHRTVNGVREQVNEITAFLDASMVYGSDSARAAELRTLDGNYPALFLAGDVRVNEQAGLIAIHTLFVREHNHWADFFKTAMPAATDEEAYQLARALVAAEIQIITYKEFLPLLLGPDALSPYAGYSAGVNPGIENAFSTAAFRVGHTLLSPALLCLQTDGWPVESGNLSLRSAFFNPGLIATHGGIEPLLLGLARQPAQEVDVGIVDDVRNFLFGPPGAGGFDLASLNIQRGRDHGLPSYNDTRASYGLSRRNSFAEITADTSVQARLAAAYATVEDIDLWVGGLAEDHVAGAMVGETFRTILKDQFERVRDGDRFWHENHLPQTMLDLVKDQTLADIIRRNTNLGAEMQARVFEVPAATSELAVQLTGNQLRLKWPGMFTDMTLQAATRLDSPDWVDVPAVGNGTIMEMTGPARFFRLLKP
jgi:peroxidase